MNSASADSRGKAFTQTHAEHMIRALWVVYNNMGLYKSTHPLTMRALADLHALLAQFLPQGESVSVFVERGALVCEEWVISPKFYGDRLITRFKDAGIQSLTIAGGASPAELEALAVALCSVKEYPLVNEIAAFLKSQNVRSLRFNYITYQKVTADESIVRQDLRRLAEIFTSGAPLHEIGESADALVGSPSQVGRDSAASLASRLKAIREMIGSGALPAGGRYPTAQELAEVLRNLRKNALDSLQAGLLEGNLAESQEAVMGELEQLTCDVMMRIVREEYRKGAISVPRLAEIIEHLVPEKRTLRRLLPLLKKTLVEEGMPLDDYLALMKELLAKTSHKDLLGVFAEEGARIGVTVDEIVEGIRRNPQAAVRMLILAAEIDSLAGAAQAPFENLLADYVNEVYEKYLASEALGTAQERELAIQRLEQDLMERFVSAGLAPQTIDGVRALFRRQPPDSAAPSAGAGEDSAPAALRASAGRVAPAGALPAATADAATAGSGPGAGAVGAPGPVGVIGGTGAPAGGSSDAAGAGNSAQGNAAGGVPSTAQHSITGFAAPAKTALRPEDAAEDGVAGPSAGAADGRFTPPPHAAPQTPDGYAFRASLIDLAAEIGGLLPSSPDTPARIAEFLFAVEAEPASAGASRASELAQRFVEELRQAGVPAGRLARVSGAVARALEHAYSSISSSMELTDGSQSWSGALLPAIAGIVKTPPSSSGGKDMGFARMFEGPDLSRFKGFLALASEIGGMTGSQEHVRAAVQRYLQRLAGEAAPSAEHEVWLGEELQDSGVDAAQSRELARRIAGKLTELTHLARGAGIAAADCGESGGGEFAAAAAHLAGIDSPPAAGDSESGAGQAAARRKPLFSLPKGILKSRQLRSAIRNEILRYRRYRTPFSTICCSLDKQLFHSANALEEAMPALAQRLLGRIRELDRIGVIGAMAGGLFVVVLPNTGAGGARQAIDRLQAPLDGAGRPEPVFSMMSPVDSPDEDETSYLARARAEHNRCIKEMTMKGKRP